MLPLFIFVVSFSYCSTYNSRFVIIVVCIKYSILSYILDHLIYLKYFQRNLSQRMEKNLDANILLKFVTYL